MELQSAVIAINLGLTAVPPSSWDKGCPDKHYIGNVEECIVSSYKVSVYTLPHDLGGLTDCISFVLSVVIMLTHMTTSLPVGSLYAYNYHFAARRYICLQ